MALFGFDSDPFEYLDGAVHDLEEKMREEGDTRISVRPGYTGSPRNYDLWRVTDFAFKEDVEAPWKMEKLDDYLERFIDSESYLDWTLHDGLEGNVATVGVYERDGDELLIEVYEEGRDGHEIFRSNDGVSKGLF